MIITDDEYESLKSKEDWTLLKIKTLFRILVPLKLFTMELTKITSWSLTFALVLKRHEKLLK